MRKTLKELELYIPTLDVLTCKQLMGGDGYYDDERINDIQEVVIIGERPDSLPEESKQAKRLPWAVAWNLYCEAWMLQGR